MQKPDCPCVTCIKYLPVGTGKINMKCTHNQNNQINCCKTKEWESFCENYTERPRTWGIRE